MLISCTGHSLITLLYENNVLCFGLRERERWCEEHVLIMYFAIALIWTGLGGFSEDSMWMVLCYKWDTWGNRRKQTIFFILPPQCQAALEWWIAGVRKINAASITGSAALDEGRSEGLWIYGGVKVGLYVHSCESSGVSVLMWVWRLSSWHRLSRSYETLLSLWSWLVFYNFGERNSTLQLAMHIETSLNYLSNILAKILENKND